MKLTRLLNACLFGVSLLTLPVAYAAVPQDAAAPVAQQAAQPVNINTADAATLAGALRGIGLSKAEAIVAYRNENGPFKTVDDLVNVRGIGAKTLEQLRPMVAL